MSAIAYESWRDGKCVVRTVGGVELHERHESSYRTATNYDGELQRYQLTPVGLEVSMERFRPAVEALRKQKRAMLLAIGRGQLAENFRAVYVLEIAECDNLIAAIDTPETGASQ